MEDTQYNLTCEDLNPVLLFSGILKRTETEENYHSHDFVEIVIVLEGQGAMYIDGKEYPSKAGDIFILNPGTYHKSLRTDSEHCASECYLSFTNIAFCGCPANTFPLFADNGIVYTMDSKMKQQISLLCSSITQEIRDFRIGRDFMLKSYLIQILCLIIRSQAETEKHQRPSSRYIFHSPNRKYVVERIKDYMNIHYQEKISLDQIASNMYLSTFYISKIFKSETGDTPINYLIRLRMEKAKDLLVNRPEISIQQIADEVGYPDTYHFSKLFKKYCDFSPSYYRETYYDKNEQ